MCTCGHAQSDHRYTLYECTVTAKPAQYSADGSLLAAHEACPCVAYADQSPGRRPDAPQAL